MTRQEAYEEMFRTLLYCNRVFQNAASCGHKPGVKDLNQIQVRIARALEEAKAAKADA